MLLLVAESADRIEALGVVDTASAIGDCDDDSAIVGQEAGGDGDAAPRGER